MVFASYCFQLLGSSCFEEFSITDSINATLDGNALNLVTDFGRYPCFAFSISLCYLLIFTFVQRLRVSRMLARSVERVAALSGPRVENDGITLS